jgi:ABC-2 type transport system permease protein
MLSRIARLLRMYARLQWLHLRVQLEYEADFWIGVVGMILKHGASLIFIWTLFRLIPEIEGWSVWEMALLYALYVIPLGLVELFYDGQWRLPQLVNLGEFDRILLRPISPALQVVTQIASVHGLGSVLVGSIVLIRALMNLQVSFAAWQYVFLLVTLINSTLLIGSLNFITNCIVFWEPAQSAPFPVFVQNMTELAKYPNNLYTGWVRILTTWILPLSFVSYFPAVLLLGKPEISSWLSYLTPLTGPLMLAITFLVWRRALARYQGTGS